MKLLLLPLVAACACLSPSLRSEPGRDVVLTRLPDRVQVAIGGQPFTAFVFAGARRPYCYPVLADDGTQLARDFPMQATPGEDHDHPHHRSLWFAHSSVDGIDFWNEDPAGGRVPKGTIVPDGPVATTDGKIGSLRVHNRWLSPAGQVVCTDDTTVRFFADADGRYLDYSVTLHARPEAPLTMGDNKDGVLALRVAQWMTLPHRYEKQDLPGVGHIVNSAGDRDGAAWGRRADWCDYYAPHGGQVYGVAIFDSPRNLRHPTYWQARDYGLFGANAFGKHDYENLRDQPHAGDYVIPAGGSLTLTYRLLFHRGDPASAHVAEHYRQFAAEAGDATPASGGAP